MTRSTTKLVVMLILAVLTACDQYSLFDELGKVVSEGDGLRIVPSSAIVNTSSVYNFTAIGGTPPYDFQVAGLGSVTVTGRATARYTAPGGETLDTVRLVDAEGDSSDAKVNVLTPQTLSLNPSSITLQVNAIYAFYAVGGNPPYTYSVEFPLAGGGSIDSGTGLYTAPAVPPGGAVVLRVTDALSTTSDSAVTVVNAGVLGISPGTATVEQGTSALFSGFGGTGSYSYSVIPSAKGVIPGGVFTPLPAAVPGDVVTVRVTDSAPATADATVQIAPAAPTNLVADGTVPGPQDILLTWSDNATGESGYEIWEKPGGGAFALIQTTAADVTNYTVIGRIPNTPYTYKVRARNPDGINHSAFSDLAFDIPNS